MKMVTHDWAADIRKLGSRRLRAGAYRDTVLEYIAAWSKENEIGRMVVSCNATKRKYGVTNSMPWVDDYNTIMIYVSFQRFPVMLEKLCPIESSKLSSNVREWMKRKFGNR